MMGLGRAWDGEIYLSVNQLGFSRLGIGVGGLCVT